VFRECTRVGGGSVGGVPTAQLAAGRVTYRLFSDAGCTEEVAQRGGFSLSFGATHASIPSVLPIGTYFWQAFYSGDRRDAPSSSACGAAVETVVPFIPRACSAAVGFLRAPAESEVLLARFSLSSDLSAHQRLLVRFGHDRVRLLGLQRGSCEVHLHHVIFRGAGPAVLDGEHGYVLRFAIDVSANGLVHLRLVVVRAGVVADEMDAAGSGTETTMWEGTTPVGLVPSSFAAGESDGP
jgi:hypothetical protein